VRDMAPQRLKNIKQKIEKGFEDLFAGKDIDKNRLEQEMIYYIEKLDVEEELVRLKSHCNMFLKHINDTSSNVKGKKLGFIGQEMGREINTIGSKANDAGIQNVVVEMKDDLEKIKEQLQNIL